ncbi:MAG: PEP-CTERM sorting domain-containing protein [Pyrinomonadaceae bacterium]
MGFKQEDDHAMKHQAFRTIALMLGVMLAAAPATLAGTITYGELVRTAGTGGQLRPASDVHLRLAAQGQPTAQVGSTQSGTTSSQEQQASGQQPATPNGTTNISAPASSDPTLSQSGGKVETVDLGDVTGTVCDCGEIPKPPLPKGGFPWWTLAGIPLICVSGICAGGEETPPTTPNPTPTPPTTPTPEPISLFLFGTGLLAVGASARRRYGRKQFETDTLSATTEEI